ncbi:hypothetical protein OG21DRAFT_1527405 [Imleria badia]|nr:hypothetical protein OG21DRAFT_1527405 [Imleria badia]
MTNIAAYIAAYGITVHDADDAVWWVHSVAREMLNHIDESGGSDNPSTAAHYGPIRRDRQIPCTNDSLNRTRKWYESKARTRGVPLSEDDTFLRFNKAALIYDIVTSSNDMDDVGEPIELDENGGLAEDPSWILFSVGVTPRRVLGVNIPVMVMVFVAS